MKKKKTKILLISLIFFTLFLFQPLFGQRENQILASEEPEILIEPSLPGRIEGSGKYFEIKDSEYLNIIIKSEEGIRVVLESIPRMISIDISSATDATSTVLTINGLGPNKTYYKYQDSYKKEEVVVSNGKGILTWPQDLTQPHHIWIQEEKGTIFLPEKENKYGIWDELTRTYTLNQDLTESVEMIESDFTFDGNGYAINGKGAGYGIYVSWEKANNITIKNVSINNFSHGILLWFSWKIKIESNVISNNNGNGLHLVSSSEIILNNEINFNQNSGIYYYARGGETISGLIQGNNVSNNGSGMYLHNQGGLLGGTSIIDNILNLNDYGLVLRGTYSYDFSSNNEIKNNNFFNNTLGLYLTETTKDNLIYHNNFLNNISQSHNAGINNLFDNGYPSGGNYWSDYTEVDEKSDQNQDQPGSDGIGDTPYTFYGGQDRYPFMKESGWKLPPPPEKWSFAIITDLHIGRGYPDYNGEGFEDDYSGEDYYLPKRLEKVVNWINENKNNIDCNGTKCPIQFVAVLGDIADTAEKSEFLKAKNILDKLNDPNGDGNTIDGIPYVPVFGNHDVWSYTDFEEAKSALGENYFEEIFWDENATNTKLLVERFGFQRDNANPKYKNFAFNYNEINFIGLDFVKRAKSAEAEIFTETENWLQNKLNKWQGKEPVILFSHHPFAEPGSRDHYVERWWNFTLEEINKIKGLIEEYENVIEGKQMLGSFGGHIHGYYPQEFFGIELPLIEQSFEANWEYPQINTTSVLTTEALMVSGNEKDLSNKGIIRVVKVIDKNNIDYSTVEGKFPALNPYISFDYKIFPEQIYPCIFLKAHTFTNREKDLVWEINGTQIGTGIIATHCGLNPGVYTLKLRAIDKETEEEEFITRTVKIKEGIIPKIIKITEKLKEKVELISTELGEKVTEFGRTMRDWVLIKVKYSPSTPAGLINVHFEKATEDIDLTDMVADTDLNTRKSILYIPSWPNVIEKEKILFIPK